MRGVGITWDSEAVRLFGGAPHCGGLALGVQAGAGVVDGRQLCSIPKAACISTRTASLAGLLEAERLGGGLGLVTAVMHEMSLGADSRWHGYFLAAPRREYLPVFWAQEEVLLLQGTELEGRPAQALADMAEDYRDNVVPLAARYPDRLGVTTLDTYLDAASLVASRGFGVDPFHGMALVPLADVFNHKAAAVALSDAYAVNGMVSSSSGSSEYSGSSGEGGSEQAGSEAASDATSSGEVQEAGEEGAEGLQASGNDGTASRPGDAPPKEAAGQATGDGAGLTADGIPGSGVMRGDGLPSALGLSHANGLHLGLEIAILDQDDRLQIIAASAVAAGQEIHNTYGELGNDELVMKYGFALRQNPFTTVRLRKAAVVQACRAQYTPSKAASGGGKRRRSSGSGAGDAAVRRLSKVLEHESELLNDEEEPFEVMPNGHIGPALFATLRVLCSGAEGGVEVTSLAQALTLPGEVGGGEGIDPGRIGAVQVWPVLGADGEALPDIEAAALAHSSQGGLGVMVTAPMCLALVAAVDARLERYPTDQSTTLTELEEVEGGKVGKVPSAGEVARRAALTLRVTEQEALAGVKLAAQRRLNHLLAAGA